MSLATLKLELESRSGRELLPNFFPMELLISFTREIALVVEGSLSPDELVQFANLLQAYFRSFVQTRGPLLLEEFDARSDELRPALTKELYDFMCEEIVSKVIGHDIKRSTLRERLLSVFDTEEEAQ